MGDENQNQSTETSNGMTSNAPAGNAGGGQEQQTQQTQQGDQSQQTAASTTTTTSPPTGLGREEIAAIVQEAMRGVPQVQQQPQRQMTQEEIDTALRVYRPNMRTLDRIRAGGEEGLAALSEVIQGVYNQAVTMAQYQTQMQIEPVTSALTPLQAFHQEQQVRQLRDEFMKANPDLKGYEPLLDGIRQQLVTEGARFPSKEAAFKEVAARAKQIIKTLPGVGQAGQQQQTQQTQGQPHNMSTLTGGGQGSTNQANGAANQNKFAWQASGL